MYSYTHYKTNKFLFYSKVTTRGWWKKADKREKIDTNEPPLDFQWHKQSTLPDSTVKLNKNQIIE